MRRPFPRYKMPCYSSCIAPVTRNRDWRPATLPRRKPWSLFAESAAFVSVPLYGGSGREAHASPVSSGSVRYANLSELPPLIGVRSGGFCKSHSLEASMAATPSSLAPASPTSGTPDPIQLHADAHNALNMAVFYLRQPQANLPGARRKAIQALSALRNLSATLEG